ncbi:fluoride efflux transporter CrcB [Nocardia sp. NPDC052566]|uniref:fluoride efflux transporter CrcB n=1 Tax=Nocardia sp. NPDC052566 TaxID=3364330 RepID=UPI0037C56BFC
MSRAWEYLVIAVGGGLGAAARYGVAQLFPVQRGTFPLATFATNMIGCFLIGVLMVVISDIWVAHRLLRPFLGVGVLGGFTTFSTYVVEVRDLLRPGTFPLAAAYAVATVAAGLFAVVAAVRCTRALLSLRRTRFRSRPDAARARSAPRR